MSSLEYNFRDTVIYQVTFEVQTTGFTKEVRTAVVATNLTANRGYRWDLIEDAMLLAVKQMVPGDIPTPKVTDITQLAKGIDAWMMR